MMVVFFVRFVRSVLKKQKKKRKKEANQVLPISLSSEALEYIC